MMSERNAVLKAIQEELDSLAGSPGMSSAPGSGVQSRKVDQPPQFSKTEKKRGFKLSGGGQAVGGDAGGVTESMDAIEKADGSGVANRSPQGVSGIDASGAPSNSGAEDSEGSAIEKADGSSVASPKAKSVDGTGGGGINAKAINKAKGNGVASRETGMSERKIIVLPHDVMVEDNDGNIKNLPKGTRVVIGENLGFEDEDGMDGGVSLDSGIDDMSLDAGVDTDECPVVDAGVDEDLITKIVTAVVQALNGGGEYDYAMEGKEILPEALLEDVKKIMEKEDPHAAALGRKSDDEQDTADKEDDEDPHAVALAKKESKEKKFGKNVLRERGEYCEEEEELDGIEDIGGGNELEDEVGESSPDYVAGLIDDVKDDLDGIKDALGFEDDEEMEFEDDEEMEFEDDEEMEEEMSY